MCRRSLIADGEMIKLRVDVSVLHSPDHKSKDCATDLPSAVSQSLGCIRKSDRLVVLDPRSCMSVMGRPAVAKGKPGMKNEKQASETS
jgi:hypothetical protein